jgi:hypothetical protein
MESRLITFVTASAVFMTVLLLLDRDGFPQQLALGAATTLFLGSSRERRRFSYGRSSVA